MPASTVRTAACALAFALAAAGLVGCNTRKGPPPEMPPPKVTVARPVSHSVQRYSEYNGFLDAVEMVSVKARVKGTLLEIHYTEGDEVKVGDPLYTIDPREYLAARDKSWADRAKARADILNWDAQIRFAAAEFKRLSEAATGGGTAKTEVEKAAATLDVNKAQLDAARAGVGAAEAAVQTADLELSYTEISAPIAGRISRTQVTKGNLVGQNETTLLTTIVRMDPLYVFFDVPEPNLVAYQRALFDAATPSVTSSEIPVEVGVATETGYPHKGTINFRENRVDTGTGTVRIRGTLANPAKRRLDGTDARLLYPGLYARVRVPRGVAEPQLLIPEAALMTGQEGRYVYVVKADNTVEKRLVVVGTRVGILNAIERGLTAADRVIINGVQKARPDGKSKVDPDEAKLTPPTS